MVCNIFKFFQFKQHYNELDLFRKPINDKRIHGIVANVKEIIEEIVHNGVTKPKNIHIKLHKPEYFDKITVMPSLKKIQNYIFYRRRLIGDQNDIEVVSNYVQEHLYNESNGMFLYGSMLGNGTDSDHIQVSFTNKKLLSRVNFFSQLKKLCKLVLNYDFEPKCIMSDASKSIGNAVEIVFPNSILLMWFHMKQCIKKHLPKDFADEINTD